MDSLALGLAIGGLAGYIGGKVDTLLTTFAMNTFLALPGIPLAIAFAAFLGPGFTNLILALSIGGWAGYARLVRAQVPAVREREYVEAARALGAGGMRIFFEHILPNIVQPILVQATIGMPGVILAEATLSFLGLFVPAPAPSWAAMLNDSRLHLFDSPHLLIFPAGTIAGASAKCFAINLILARGLKSGYDSAMFTLHKGECEHCSRAYRYMLLHAGFGDFSYAYCDGCGTTAVFSFTNRDLANLPPNPTPNQVIASAWEPFLRPCSCSGHFRKEASPRCVGCNSVLSAEYAGSHIEQNFHGAARGWHWQKDWTGTYCLVIEDPTSPGTLRQIADPIIRMPNPNEGTFKRFLTHIFSPSR